MLNDIGFIAANTSRTRAYLAALERNNLLPSWYLLLDDDSQKARIGQAQVNFSNKKKIYQMKMLGVNRILIRPCRLNRG